MVHGVINWAVKNLFFFKHYFRGQCRKNIGSGACNIADPYIAASNKYKCNFDNSDFVKKICVGTHL